MPPLPDRDLVERVRAGDAAAFELIMRRHNRRLFRLARSILRNGPEAEDVVQATYVRAYARLDAFVGPDGFPSWLGRIALRGAWSGAGVGPRRGARRSRERRRGKCRAATDRHHEHATSRSRGLGRQCELRRLLEDAIDALPDEFRTVFILRAVEGMTVAETADALSIRPETVKTRFHRARRRLQATLGARFEALTPAAFEFGGEHCDRIVAVVLARLRPPGREPCCPGTNKAIRIPPELAARRLPNEQKRDRLRTK